MSFFFELLRLMFHAFLRGNEDDYEFLIPTVLTWKTLFPFPFSLLWLKHGIGICTLFCFLTLTVVTWSPADWHNPEAAVLTVNGCFNGGECSRSDPLDIQTAGKEDQERSRGYDCALIFPSFGLVLWQPWASSQLCPFWWACSKQPEAAIGLVQTGCVTKLTESLPPCKIYTFFSSAWINQCYA